MREERADLRAQVYLMEQVCLSQFTMFLKSRSFSKGKYFLIMEKWSSFPVLQHQ